jgi:cytidylate kinase
MFNPENLKIGDKFYSVKERNQSFRRKKIYKEIDGEDWFKYDMPLRTYEIATWEVVGILRKHLEGRWKHDPDGVDTATEYFVRYTDETHVGNHVIDF